MFLIYYSLIPVYLSPNGDPRKCALASSNSDFCNIVYLLQKSTYLE